MRVRHIKTKSVPLLDEKKRTVVKDGATVMQTVPELDVDGNEAEEWAIEIPQAIEAKGGEAVDAYVAEQLAKSPPASPKKTKEK